MATDSGFSNQKKKGIAQFETVHHLGSERYGKAVSNKGLTEVTPEAAIVSVTPIYGRDGQIEFHNVELTAHGAVVGNVLRLTSGPLNRYEYDILEILDADHIKILAIDGTPVAADLAVIMAWVTQTLSDDGSMAVAITTPPTQFNYDGAPQTVEQDTAVAANNRAMPSLQFIYKDGVQVPVTKDTGVPSNTVGIPVELVAASGTPINITAGDLNVQLTDLGANFDCTRLGDGSGAHATFNYGLGSLALRVAAQIGNALGEAAFGASATDSQTLRTSSNITRNGNELSYDVGIADPNTIRVILASDSVVNAAPLTATFQNILNLTTVAQNFIPPIGARWCKIYADDTNTANIRVKVGGIATTSSGIQFQPGRSEDYDAIATISVIAESGIDQKICVQWGAA